MHAAPLSPLPHQNYYHGPLSRVEAEALLVRDGEFLVRESSKKPGQYVLTGMALGKAQHLLLMDKHGKVGVAKWVWLCGCGYVGVVIMCQPVLIVSGQVNTGVFSGKS